MKATKKPVTIDYIPYEGDIEPVRNWVKSFGDNFDNCFEYDLQIFFDDLLWVKSSESTNYEVTTDDMIIRDTNGEYVAFKKDIFYKTYDICPE